jgi:hypothetical protein
MKHKFDSLLGFFFMMFCMHCFMLSAQTGKVMKPDSSSKENERGIGMSVAQSDPEFPGGQDSLSAFLFHNLKQPEKLTPKGKWKHEFVGFVVDKNGKVKTPRILLSLGDKADAEALRIVSLMPDWKPATVAGNPVDKDYVLSIDFFVPGVE